MVELVCVLVLAFVPLLHLAIGLGEVQRVAIVASSAAREAVRAAVSESDPAGFSAQAVRAAHDVMGGNGLTGAAVVHVNDDDGDAALERGEFVSVEVTYSVNVFPPLDARVEVEGQSNGRRDPCRSVPTPDDVISGAAGKSPCGE